MQMKLWAQDCCMFTFQKGMDGGCLQVRTCHGDDVAMPQWYTFPWVCMCSMGLITGSQWNTDLAKGCGTCIFSKKSSVTWGLFWQCSLVPSPVIKAMSIWMRWRGTEGQESMGLVDCVNPRGMLNDLYEENGVLKDFQTNCKKNKQAKELFLI